MQGDGMCGVLVVRGGLIPPLTGKVRSDLSQGQLSQAGGSNQGGETVWQQ
jgi:hypothetical protein